MSDKLNEIIQAAKEAEIFNQSDDLEMEYTNVDLFKTNDADVPRSESSC